MVAVSAIVGATFAAGGGYLLVGALRALLIGGSFSQYTLKRVGIAAGTFGIGAYLIHRAASQAAAATASAATKAQIVKTIQGAAESGDLLPCDGCGKMVSESEIADAGPMGYPYDEDTHRWQLCRKCKSKGGTSGYAAESFSAEAVENEIGCDQCSRFAKLWFYSNFDLSLCAKCSKAAGHRAEGTKMDAEEVPDWVESFLPGPSSNPHDLPLCGDKHECYDPDADNQQCESGPSEAELKADPEATNCPHPARTGPMHYSGGYIGKITACRECWDGIAEDLENQWVISQYGVDLQSGDFDAESFKDWADDEDQEHGDISFDTWIREEMEEPTHESNPPDSLTFLKWARKERKGYTFEADHDDDPNYDQSYSIIWSE